MAKAKKKKYSASDKAILGIGYVLLGAFVLSILVPLLYVVIASFMDPNVLNSQGISFDVRKWTIDAYRRVLENNMIWRGFANWAILLPGAFNVWNMILARTYYQSIPKELREASAIDGATEIEHFFKIMMPVCKPIIAVLALWSFVGMWNSYFDAMIYLNDAKLQPLQLVLRSILVQNTPQPGMIADIQSTAQMAKVAELLKYATIIVSSLPLLIMYPFFQKYFDQGIMVGSVKG